MRFIVAMALSLFVLWGCQSPTSSSTTTTVATTTTTTTTTVAVSASSVKTAVAKLPTFATVLPASIAAKTARSQGLSRSALGTGATGVKVYGDNYAWDSIPAYYSNTYSKLTEYQAQAEESLVNKMVTSLKTFTSTQSFQTNVEQDYTFAFFTGYKAVSKIKIVPSTVANSKNFEVFWTLLVFQQNSTTKLYTTVNATGFSHLTITYNSDGTILAKVAMNVFGDIADDGTNYTPSTAESTTKARMQYYASYDEANNGKIVSFSKMYSPSTDYGDFVSPAATVYAYDAGATVNGVTEFVSQMAMDSDHYDDRVYLWANATDGVAVRQFNMDTSTNGNSTETALYSFYSEDFYNNSLNILSRAGEGFVQGDFSKLTYNYRWPIQYLRPLNDQVLVEYRGSASDTLSALYLAPKGTTASTFSASSPSNTLLPWYDQSGQNYLSAVTSYQYDSDGTTTTKTTLADNALAWLGPVTSGSYQPAKLFSYTKESSLSTTTMSKVSGWNTNMISNIKTYSFETVTPSTCPSLTVTKATITANGASTDK